MALTRPARRVAVLLLRTIVVAVAVVLVGVGLALLVAQTGWAKNRIRSLIVSQANEYLTGTLAIERLGGSLVRGLELDGVRLTRDGDTLVVIERVQVAYSIRELVQHGTVIRRLRLVRPEIHGARNPDGSWNLSGLVRTRPPRPSARSPRPLEISSIDVVDATVRLTAPVTAGPVHVPADLEHLNAALSLAYAAPVWTIGLQAVSWQGHDPELPMKHMAGTLGIGGGLVTFRAYTVETPTSAFRLDGTLDRRESPTRLDLDVHAGRFDFQAWGGILPGLSKIGVVAGFDVKLRGPTRRMATTLDLHSTGGSVRGTLVLDTTVPGWHGQGTLDVGSIDLSRWLSNPEKPSDITGKVTFDLALELGHHFPRGSYVFDGAHAGFMGYEATRVRARGTITQTEALVRQAAARAYGAEVTVSDGSIGLDAPYPYRFAGTMAGLDLRNVPPSIPLPHVESTLALAYDVHGRFEQGYIAGGARFEPSTFLGAHLGAGANGTIDTSTTPLQYGGEGDISEFDVNRVGRGLDVAWMQDPRYAGTIAGHFRVDASGADSATLALRARGTIASAHLFSGAFADDTVSLDIADGTLATAFSGPYTNIDPAIALDDPRFRASLTGSADVQASIAELLIRSPGLDDYTVDGSIALRRSTIRGLDVAEGRLAGRIAGGVATLSRAAASGQAGSGHGSGVVSLAEDRPSNFEYALEAVDLARLAAFTGRPLKGVLATTGRLTGAPAALRMAGDGSVRDAGMPGFSALAVSSHYDVTVPSGRLDRAAAALQGAMSFAQVAGMPVEEAHGTITLADLGVGFHVDVKQAGGRSGSLSGAVVVDPDRRQLAVSDLTIAFGASPWRLTAATPPPTVDFSGPGVSLTPMAFVGGPSLEQQITLSGAWGGPRPVGLHVAARNVRLETLASASSGPARYGGVVELDATIRGTRRDPIVIGRVRIDDGRVRRLTYQRFAGQVDYHDGIFDIAFRLDQAPDVWLRADGTVPLALFDRTLPPRPIGVTVTSSLIDLGLIEGVTDVIRDVGGKVHVDLRAGGTSRDPQFVGSVGVADAAFMVAATGVRYKNVRADLELQPDQIAVRALHVEDPEGHPLDVNGTLATQQLQIGAVTLDMKARHLSVLRNSLGNLETDATLAARGTVQVPHLSGQVSIQNGAIRVDRILDQLLFRPYSTDEAPGAPTASSDTAPPLDALVALNPWDRLALAIDLKVPETLRMTGQDIQVTPGTPIGLGSINLRTGGDLWLIKDPGQGLAVYGSLDSVNGTYAFQGRQFEIQPGGSINFRGDVAPEVYVTVAREISGVQTRVTIAGPLKGPELRLASTPPLDPSDVLSLVVFGTTTNQLNTAQQQELAVRAGALAAGFLATPIVSALESSLGLQLLEIEPAGEFGTGPKITVGQELAPGLVARFSRQFGQAEYDQAIIEYYLSRILQLRATFSDAASLNIRSPFRRIERAGVDLLFFFSF